MNINLRSYTTQTKRHLSVVIFICLLTLPFLTKGEKHTIYRDIPYVQVNSSSFDAERHVLDVYAPRIKNAKTEVVVFIHGGKWKVGSKDMFNYVGINFAEKGKTAVLINYRLTPNVLYDDMAMDCARAIQWVYSQIEYYGGDKNKIFIYGHSSGGHLAALVATNTRFFDSLQVVNPVKGCVLIDAFGMDMSTFLQKPPAEYEWMYDTFTKEPEKWKDASPTYFVSQKSPKCLMFLGERTFPIIEEDMKKFNLLLKKNNVEADLYIIDNRKHMEMIGQLFDFRNEIYDKCIAFMKSP